MMTREEQLNLLARITEEQKFVADPVDYEENKEEKKIRERFEQGILRMSGRVLRYTGGSMGLIPELIIGVWDNFSREELAQLLIHAYRGGLRVSEVMDAVYPAASAQEEAVTEEKPTKEPKPAKTEANKAKKGTKKMSFDDVWSELDGATETAEAEQKPQEETKEEKGATQKATRRRTAARKPTTTTKTKEEPAARPEKSALESKVDDLMKAVMQMQNIQTEQKKILDGVISVVEGLEPVIIRNSINIDQVLEASARAMVQLRWLCDQSCKIQNLKAGPEYKKQKEQTDRLI